MRNLYAAKSGNGRWASHKIKDAQNVLNFLNSMTFWKSEFFSAVYKKVKQANAQTPKKEGKSLQCLETIFEKYSRNLNKSFLSHQYEKK